MEEKDHKFWWVLLGIIGALLVAGIVFLVYYFYFFKTRSVQTTATPTATTSASPSPSSSSNFSTYQSDCCGFSFDYPNDWEIEDYYFYETAGGEKANIPTIILKRKSDPKTAERNKIWLNMRQTECDVPGSSKSTETAGSVTVNVYTLSGSPDVCLQATVIGQDTNGQKADFDVVSFYNETMVKAAFKTIISTFQVAPL